MNWNEFKRDFKERFLNFETAKGIYLFPVGVFGIYVAVWHIEYAIQAMALAYFGYMTFEGVRKIFVNRILQSITKKKMQEDHEGDN